MGKTLQVPYLSQGNNWYNPGGSCNVTSVAMCLAYYGVPTRVNGSQLEDVLYQECYRRGLSRHSPLDLAILAKEWSRDYGLPVYDDFTVYGTIDDICANIDAGHPCVTHGYWTNYGHIIAIVGYDDRGAIVHDPWGEAYRGGGYDRNDSANGEKGKFQSYSWDFMREVCYDPGDNSWWVHRFNGPLPDAPASEPNPYTDLGDKKTIAVGIKLGDFIDRRNTEGEDDIEIEFRAGASVDGGLIVQIQICLNNHVKVQPQVTVDGVLGPQTEGAYNKMADRFKLKKSTVAYEHARVLIQGHA